MAAVVGVSSTSGVGTLTAPVAVTAFTSACFGTTSPDSVNLNLFGADFLVVAVGWSSASSAYTPPLVACNGEVMTLVTSAREWDTASGAVAIYTLPIFNAANTSVPITLTQTTFIGNVQIAAYAYRNSSQSLGVIINDEYGTNSSGVNTGTTAINGVSAASAFTFAGFTFFGGTPTAITFPAGWTDSNQATGTNEGVYCAYTNQTGNYSVTVTPSPSSFFNMLCMGWEVLAGQPPSTGSGVNLVAYTTVAFGSVTAAAPGNTTFDPTTAANLLVATVGWASSGTLTAAQAVVTFGGSTMTLQATPQKIDGSNGAVAVWTLPLSSATSSTFTFNCSPNFAGLTSVALAAYSNASTTLGATVSDEYGSNGVEVPSGTTAISGVTYGSSFGYVAMGFFGNAPTYLDCSTGWNPISNASATNQSVYAFNYRYQNQNSFSITLQNPTVDFNTLNVGYEVLAASDVFASVTGVGGTGAVGTLTYRVSSFGGITAKQVPVGAFPFNVLVNENQASQIPTGGAALVDQTASTTSSSATITGVTGTGAVSNVSVPASITGVVGTAAAGTATGSTSATTINVAGVALTPIGSASGKGVTSISITLPANLPAGCTIFVAIAALGNTVPSVSDSFGQTHWVGGNGQATATVTTILDWCWNAQAMNAGNTITVTSPSGTFTAAATVFYATGIYALSNPFDVAGFGSGTGTLPTATTTGLNQSGELVIGSLAVASASSDIFVQDINYPNTYRTGTTGGSDITIDVGAMLTVATSGQTYAPTLGTSAAYAEYVATFKATLGPSGVLGTGAASALIPGAASGSITGVTGTGAAGSPSVTLSSSGSITGVTGTGAAGSPSVTSSSSVSITGLSGSGQAGTVTTSAGNLVSITGVPGTGLAGSVTPSSDNTVPITGVSGTGQAGTVTTNAGNIALVIGVVGTGAAGSLSVVSSSSVSITGVSGTGAVATIRLPVSDTVLRQVPVASYPFAVFVNENQTFQAPLGAALLEQTVLAPTLVSIVGTLGTGAAGSPRGEIDHPFIGVTGTGQIGSLIAGLSVRIGGVFGSGRADVSHETITNQPVMMICL